MSRQPAKVSFASRYASLLNDRAKPKVEEQPIQVEAIPEELLNPEYDIDILPSVETNQVTETTSNNNENASDSGEDTEEMKEDLIQTQLEEFLQRSEARIDNAESEEEEIEETPSKKRKLAHEEEIEPSDLEIEGGGLVPYCLAKCLRDYQVQGITFLYKLYKNKKGGILADDMGLGKTVQSIAFLSAVLNKSKSVKKTTPAPVALLVVPASVITQWVGELEKWGAGFGGFKCVQYHGEGRAAARESKLLNQVPWEVVIFDEAHRLKSTSSQTSKAAKEIKTKCRYGLTGTVMQNSLDELWNLIDWCSPNLLGSLEQMRNTYIQPIKWGQRVDATQVEIALGRRASLLLSTKIKEVVLRRDKTLIAHLLPKKIDHIIYCPLSPLQNQIYTKIMELPEYQLMINYSEPCQKCKSGLNSGRCHGAWTPDGVEVKTLLLSAISRLQKLANHPFLLLPNPSQAADKFTADDKFARKIFDIQLYKELLKETNQKIEEYSGKLIILNKLLPEWTSHSYKILIFSKSTKMLDLLEKWLSKLKYRHLRYDGSLSVGVKRQAIIDKFSTDPKIPILLISTGAGALGLNITAANIVVIFDPSWNASVDLQAQDRAFRIGQTKDCKIFRFISSGTVEEAQYQRQIYKQQMHSISLEGKKERRLFTGVQGVQGQEGELFGISNLLRQSSNMESIIKRNKSLEDSWSKETSIEIDKTQVDDTESNNTTVVPSDNPDGNITLELLKPSDENIEEQLEKINEEINNSDAKRSKISATELALQNSTGVKKIEVNCKKGNEDDRIAQILKQTGVAFTHTNNEVVGESTGEVKISEAAEKTVYGSTSISNIKPKIDYISESISSIPDEERKKNIEKKKEEAKNNFESRMAAMMKQSGLF